MAIVGAEHVMRWLPKGTHDWRSSSPRTSSSTCCAARGCEPVDRKGMVFNPLALALALSDRDLSVNYVTASVRD